MSTLHHMSATMEMPRLGVVHQYSLTQDERPGEVGMNETHYVVKNSPFKIKLALSTYEQNAAQRKRRGMVQPPAINFHNISFDATLFYVPKKSEGDDMDREVTTLNQKPMSYKVQVDATGNVVTFEVRLHVLTSQHEGHLFRVRFRALDTRTLRELSELLACNSAPIKVVSKPDLVRKKPKRSSSKLSVSSAASSSSTAAAMGGDAVSASEMLDYFQRVEQRVNQQMAALQQLSALQDYSFESINRLVDGVNFLYDQQLQTESANMGGSGDQGFSSSTSMFGDGTDGGPDAKRRRLDGNGNGLPRSEKKGIDFDATYEELVDSFNQLCTDEPANVSQTINEAVRQHFNIAEVHDLFWAEGLDKLVDRQPSALDQDTFTQMGMGGGGVLDGCACNPCPLRLQANNVDGFYNEMFASMHPPALP